MRVAQTITALLKAGCTVLFCPRDGHIVHYGRETWEGSQLLDAWSCPECGRSIDAVEPKA